MELTLRGFMGIMRRNNHPYLVQIGRLSHDVGYDEVPYMNRVKGSEEESDFQIV